MAVDLLSHHLFFTLFSFLEDVHDVAQSLYVLFILPVLLNLWLSEKLFMLNFFLTSASHQKNNNRKFRLLLHFFIICQHYLSWNIMWCSWADGLVKQITIKKNNLWTLIVDNCLNFVTLCEINWCNCVEQGPGIV